MKVQRSDSFHLLQAQLSALKGLLKGHGLFKVPELFLFWFSLALLFQGSLVRQSCLRHGSNLTVEHYRAPVISPLQNCTASCVVDESVLEILTKCIILNDGFVYICGGWIVICSYKKTKTKKQRKKEAQYLLRKNMFPGYYMPLNGNLCHNKLQCRNVYLSK